MLTDLNEFLEKEFQSTFTRCFKTYQEFEKAMKPEAVQCDGCNTWRWKGCSKRCDCEYLETLKIRKTNVTETG